MKIDKHDAHDRYEYFTKQSFDIAECCQDLVNKRPFGSHAFYIFSHKRTLGLDEKYKLFVSGKFPDLTKVPEATIIWQPRLTKPRAQENSMLFKAYPGTDLIKVIWMIPPRELWGQYAKGLMTENQTVSESIHDFQNDREKLELKEDDDFTEAQIDAIYREISEEMKPKQWKKI